jgi:WD40 repeat protein
VSPLLGYNSAMLRIIVLALTLPLAAFDALAQPLRFTPEYTLADLREGEPAATAVESLMNVWTGSDGQPIVVLRYGLFDARIVRARINPDGDADMGTLRTDLMLNLLTVAPSGSGAVEIWSNGFSTFATRLDPGGDEIFGGQMISTGATDTAKLACNVVRCIASLGGSPVLMTSDGILLSGLGIDFTVAAAGDTGFLVVEHCLTDLCPLTLFDNSGAIKNSATPPYKVQDIVFDGTRYVALSADDNGNVYLTSINATTGVLAAPVKIVHLPPELASVQGRLAWNGSTIGIALLLSPSNGSISGKTWVAALRSDSSFAPAGSLAQLITTDTTFDTPWITNTTDGFVILWNAGSTLRVRTSTMNNDGAIVPEPPASTPLFHAAVSQFVSTAAASRSAYLGIWSEHDGEQFSLNAARLTRFGARLDAKPLSITHGTSATNVVAASDGDNFLVAWIDADENLFIARIDSAGHVVTTPVDMHLSAFSRMSLSFQRGAYQLGVVAPDGIEAVTISAGGTVLARDRSVLATDTDGHDVYFDGQRVIAVWSSSNVIHGAVHDIGGAPPVVFDIVPAKGTSSLHDVAVRPDGNGGYFLLYTDDAGGGSATRVSLVLRSLTHDGRATGTPQTIGHTRFASGLTLLQIGGAWHASWLEYPSSIDGLHNRIIQPFNGGPPLSIPVDLFDSPIVPGFQGEALLLRNAPVSFKPFPQLGPASQATIRVISGGRVHAVRH